MRSFAVVAGFAAVALAAPQYDAYPAAPPAAPASSSAPAYSAETPAAPGYPAETPSASVYSASSAVPVYSASKPAETPSAPGYPVETPSAPGYNATTPVPVYSASKPAYTTTEVVSATTYVCPEPTVITHGPSTYTISTSTTLSIPQYTATYVHTPEAPVAPPAPTKPAYTTTEVVSATTYDCPEPTVITHGPSTYTITASTTLSIPQYTATYVHTPEPSPTAPGYTAAPPAPPAPMYPSSNGTVPAGPAHPTGTGAVPSSTKPATPEFTGAAGKVTVGFFAIAGAIAAFL